MTVDASVAETLLISSNPASGITQDSTHAFYRFILDDPSGTLTAETLETARQQANASTQTSAATPSATTTTNTVSDATDPFNLPPTPAPAPATPISPPDTATFTVGLDGLFSSVKYFSRTDYGGYTEYQYGTDESYYQALLADGWTPVYHEETGWQVSKIRPIYLDPSYTATNPKFQNNVMTLLSVNEIDQRVTAKTDYTDDLTQFLSFDADPAPQATRQAHEPGFIVNSAYTAYSHPQTEGADFPEASWGQFWLRASDTAPEDITRTFLLIRQNYEGDSTTPSNAPEVKVVKLTIKRGGRVSILGTTGGTPNGGVISLKPTALPGKTQTLALMEVEVHDYTEDRTLDTWDGSNATTLTKGATAWIQPHTSDEDATPRMPRLALNLFNLPSDWNVEAKMEVDYTRGNGAKGHQDQDKLNFPANGYRAAIFGGVDFYDDYLHPRNANGVETTALPFFGGKGKVTYKISRGSQPLIGPLTQSFAIGGKNPDNDRCKAFIQAEPDAGPGGSIAYAYAIAKHEMKEYRESTSPHFYNQFINGRWSRWLRGSPTYNNDSPKKPAKPGGYGMFSTTGDSTNPDLIIPRDQIWNWQAGARAGLEIIRFKRQVTTGWMASQKAAALAANGPTLPSLTVNGVTFGNNSNGFTMDHAVAIKAYNGLRNVSVSFTDPGQTPPGFTLNNQTQGGPGKQGQYCSWLTGSGWVINRWKVSEDGSANINYIERVCVEIEP